MNNVEKLFFKSFIIESAKGKILLQLLLRKSTLHFVISGVMLSLTVAINLVYVYSDYMAMFHLIQTEYKSLYYIFGLLYFLWGIPIIIIAVCCPYLFYYLIFQSKLAMIVLIDNIIRSANISEPRNIKNQIKAITIRHLEIKRYMDTVINSHHLLYTTYVISGIVGGLVAIAEFFSVISTLYINNMFYKLSFSACSTCAAIYFHRFDIYRSTLCTLRRCGRIFSNCKYEDVFNVTNI